MSLIVVTANPSPRPRRKATTTTKTRPRRAASKGAVMARKTRSAAQKAATRRMLAANKSRKRHHNPSPRKATKRRRTYSAAAPRRRRVHRNPGILAGGKSFLGDLATTQGLIMLAAAAAAPTVVDMIHSRVVPDAYKTGWWGIAGKAVIGLGIAYGLDKYGKQRKAALGFGIGALGSLLANAWTTYNVQSTLPAVAPAVQDQIAQNPAMYAELMNGGNQFASVNGYEPVPMAGYDAVPMGDEFESLN